MNICHINHKEQMGQKIITEKDLEKLGFKYIEDESYINGKRWLLQVSSDYVDDNNN